MRLGFELAASRTVRLLLVLGMLTALGGLLAAAGGPRAWAAQEGACTSGGPDSGAFQVRLCLTSPANGAALTGDVTVTATVETLAGTPPKVDWVQFYFSQPDRPESAAVLRDYTEPYTFTLPTDRWADRDYRLEADVEFDDYESGKVGVTVTTANGVTRLPVGTGRWVPKSIEGSDPVTVAVVGDGASGLPGTYQVADLIEGWNPQMLLYLGDIYNVGSYTEFINYYDPTLGRMKDITNPIVGDHEGGRQFQGYQDYWDSNLHYYTARAGAWQLIGLDSTDRFDQFSPGTAQFDWLHTQLEKHESECTLVFLHNPRWGLHTNYEYEKLDPLWEMLAEEGTDLVVTGHEHNYQRWVPMDKDGNPASNGTVEIVAGTGGHRLIPFNRSDDRVAAQFRTFGALKLELREGGASYQFIDVDKTVLDSGELTCASEPGEEVETDQSPPAAPQSPQTGTIGNTGGLGALCLAAPDLSAENITLLPDGTQVQVRGPQEGEWWPVRCADQDGYVYHTLIDVGGGGSGGIPAERGWLRAPVGMQERRQRG